LILLISIGNWCVAKTAVINASPLIFLSRGQHLELLQLVAETILVPEPVAVEIRARGHLDPTVKALDLTPWLRCVPGVPTPPIVTVWGLGAGESAVLALAEANPGMEAIIDDLAGRRCAALLGIPVRGTLGIVLTAKQRGVIPAARPVLECLIQSGLYLSRRILDTVLQRVGE
jgi:predicted nucleic acid-binding protein